MNKTAVWIYVVVSLVTIGVLLYFLVTYEKNQRDNFCTGSRCLCTGARNMQCQCAEQVKKAYLAGHTEYSPMGKHKWGHSNPGDMNYPPRTRCNQVNAYLKDLV